MAITNMFDKTSCKIEIYMKHIDSIVITESMNSNKDEIDRISNMLKTKYKPKLTNKLKNTEAIRLVESDGFWFKIAYMVIGKTSYYLFISDLLEVACGVANVKTCISIIVNICANIIAYYKFDGNHLNDFGNALLDIRDRYDK